MSTSNSPYAAFAALLASTGKPVSPAELHGLLLGRSCAGAGFEAEPWIADASELLGGEPTPSLETSEIGWFAQHALPADLSVGRVLRTQLERMFEHRRDPGLPTDFD